MCFLSPHAIPSTTPVRKTDVSDAQWLQRLHSYGLLRASFRPKGQIAELRAYVRQRERLLEYAASHIQHMHKPLTEMNLQLHHVVADVTGATGLRIIRAILDGERDPKVLACLRDYRCHSGVEAIEKALTGNYRAEHLFALEQALALYHVYQDKASACDARIEAVLKELSTSRGRDAGPLPSPRRRLHGKANGPDFDVRAALFKLLGKDLTQIDGLGSYLSLRLIAECGADLSAWPSAKHFTSWLCLAPSNNISGGKVLSSRTRRSGSRASALLRLAAVTVGRTDTALGAFYRRLSARIGQDKAGPAKSRRIALLFDDAVRRGIQYVDRRVAARKVSSAVAFMLVRRSTRPGTASAWSRICIGAPRRSGLFSTPRSQHQASPFLRNAVRHGMEYVDPGASFYETRYRKRVVENLHRRAKAFGFVLHPAEPTPSVAVER